MDWDDERTLIDAAATALTELDFAAYEALKAANPQYEWQPFERRKALLQGKTIEELGLNPMWARHGLSGATTTRALDKDKS